MEQRVKEQLIRARQALKKKLGTLKSDIANARRDIDIHYAPITNPLREISLKLDATPSQERLKKLKDAGSDFEESYSFVSPEKSYAAIPGTSILRQAATPQPQKRVSWFSPGVHSSPTKATQLLQSKQSPSFAEPTFLEDEYIGEYMPETPVAKDVSKSGDDEEMSDSFDMDKSMGHALSLLRSKPSKSILANKSLNVTLLDTDVVRESLKGHHPMIRPYLIGLMTDEKEEFDEKYGVRESNENLKIGNATVGFEDDKIIIGEFKYKGTKGLYELLFKKNPGKFTFADAKNYKFILQNTNAHKVNYESNNKVSASKGVKYTKFIKPILQGKPPNVWWTRTWKTGLGLKRTQKKLMSKRNRWKKIFGNVPVEYKYWDDPNELNDRLQLLLASRDAGHTGHDNEIISIIEELKESKQRNQKSKNKQHT